MMSSAHTTDRFARRVVYKSPLEGVPDSAWDAFVRVMSTQAIQGVSAGGGIGSFDLRPRRLGEIDVMTNMRREKGKWVGDLAPEYAALGRDAILQYRVFSKSMVAYHGELKAGVISTGPLVPFGTLPGITCSGALAILHCGGVEALRAWPEGAFKTTKALYGRTNKLF